MQRTRLFSQPVSSESSVGHQQSDYQVSLEAITKPKIDFIDLRMAELRGAAERSKLGMKTATGGFIVLGDPNFAMIENYNEGVLIFKNELQRYYDDVIKNAAKRDAVFEVMKGDLCLDREKLFKVKFDNSNIEVNIDRALQIAESDTAQLKVEVCNQAVKDLHRLSRPSPGCVML